MVEALGPVGALFATCSERIEENLAMQCCSASAVGETMLQDEILSFFQNRRCRIPVQGMLKNNDIMLKQSLLLSLYIYLKVRVLCIEVDQRDAIEFANGLRHRMVHFRAV